MAGITQGTTAITPILIRVAVVYAEYTPAAVAVAAAAVIHLRINHHPLHLHRLEATPPLHQVVLPAEVVVAAAAVQADQAGVVDKSVKRETANVKGTRFSDLAIYRSLTKVL
jgi:hypothetical protein